MSLWDFLFHRDKIEAEDVRRVRSVLNVRARSELAALRTLQLQVEVAEAVRRQTHHEGGINGHR